MQAHSITHSALKPETCCDGFGLLPLRGLPIPGTVVRMQQSSLRGLCFLLLAICLSLLPHPTMAQQACDAMRSITTDLNTTSKACDCKAGWAGLACDTCTEDAACSAAAGGAKGGATTCNTKTFTPTKEIRGLCEAASTNISNLIHGRGWVSVVAAANGSFSFDFIKQNSESKFVPLFKCVSSQTKVQSVDATQVQYVSPDLACNLTCTVGTDRTCTTILGNILKQVGKQGGSKVTCEPPKATCLISESTLDAFLGGVATSNCRMGECTAAATRRRMLRDADVVEALW